MGLASELEAPDRLLRFRGSPTKVSPAPNRSDKPSRLSSQTSPASSPGRLREGSHPPQSRRRNSLSRRLQPCLRGRPVPPPPPLPCESPRSASSPTPPSSRTASRCPHADKPLR